MVLQLGGGAAMSPACPPGVQVSTPSSPELVDARTPEQSVATCSAGQLVGSGITRDDVVASATR